MSREEILFLVDLGLKLKESGTLQVMMDRDDVDAVAETFDSVAEGVR